MNNDQKPSLQEWKELYTAALEFKELAPWDWMHDCDIFGVKNPENGEIGYCCIMGAAGEHYALGLYLGSEGLMGITKILSGEFSNFKDEAFFLQKCLMASFEDRKYLNKQDLAQIKTLDLKFRGSNAWPMFRNHTPGFVPWYLDSAQARFLTIALQQAIDVSKRFRKDKSLLEYPSNAHYFVRVPRKMGEDIVWQDEWLVPLPAEKEALPVVHVDETILSRLKKAKSTRKGTWEIDFFYMPAVISEKGERPCYPFMSLIVDHDSAFIFNFQIEKRDMVLTNFPAKFIEFLEKTKFMPGRILVKRDEIRRILEPLAAKLGIELRSVESLPAMEYAQRSMRGFI